ncbi:MAG: lipid II flippase MurJ [Bdellovibrionota bacterium]
MFPFLLFVSLGAVLMGIHHAHQSFTYPSIAPLMFNAASIAARFCHSARRPIYTGKTAVMIWSKFAGPCAAVLQFAIQAPPLSRAKKSLPTTQKILANRHLSAEMMILMGPAIIAVRGAGQCYFGQYHSGFAAGRRGAILT